MRSAYTDVLPAAPQADIDLDMRLLKPSIAEDDEGDPVMVLKDSTSTVILEFGLGGSWESAIIAAEKLARTATRYADLLRDVRAKRRTSWVADGEPSQKEE